LFLLNFFFFYLFFINFYIGGLYFGESVVFNISNSTFTHCLAKNYVGDGSGGGIYSASTSPGLRYLVALIFENNEAGR
jgi:hypothetical protein